MKKFIVGILLSLLAALIILAWQYRAQVIRVSTLQANISQYQHTIRTHDSAIQRLRRERDELEQLLADRELRQRDAQEQTNRLRAEIDRLRQEHEEINEWAEQRMPTAVFERL